MHISNLVVALLPLTAIADSFLKLPVHRTLVQKKISMKRSPLNVGLSNMIVRYAAEIEVGIPSQKI